MVIHGLRNARECVHGAFVGLPKHAPDDFPLQHYVPCLQLNCSDWLWSPFAVFSVFVSWSFFCSALFDLFPRPSRNEECSGACPWEESSEGTANPPRSDRVQGEGRNEAELDLSTPESGFQQSGSFRAEADGQLGCRGVDAGGLSGGKPQVCASS